MGEKLKLYKYAGGDAGILYIYFYNPLARRLVEYLPDTLAPNLITLAGFMFTVVPFFYLFFEYGWNFSTPVGAGFCYTNAVCYFIYRLLDEMDGKQARRTGNSSPLGLIFDHGCDAFTCGL
jgi:ethanolaminephosphotransferase